MTILSEAFSSELAILPPARLPGADGLSLTRVAGRNRACMLQLWRALEERSGRVPIMGSWQWVDAWLNHYADLIPHFFVVGSTGQVPRAICLVTRGVNQRDAGLQLRTLHLGTAGEPEEDSVCVEYNGWPVEPEFERPFARGLAEMFREDQSWDELRVDGVEASLLPPLVQALGQVSTRALPSHYFDLAHARQTGQDPLALLGQSTRRSIRKCLRAGGQLTCEWADDVAHAHDVFDDLIRLHQARWTKAGKPGAYASSRFTAFHRELIERLVPLGRLSLVRVRQEGNVLGCVQLLIDRRRVLYYQSGVALSEAALSHGLLVTYLALVECLARGYDQYDFLAGDGQHKRAFRSAEAKMCWVAQRRPRAALVILDTLRHVARLFKRA
jgi:hypothetical protein